MKCSSCGTSLRNDSKFCHSCGSTVKKEVVCVNCKHLLEENDAFCSQCGTRVEKSEALEQIEFSDNWNDDIDIDFSIFDEVENIEKETIVYGSNIANLVREDNGNYLKSRAISQGEWVYFWGFKTSDRNNPFIAKMKRNGDNKQIIIELNSGYAPENICLNVVEHSLYYISIEEYQDEKYYAIVKVDVDGTRKKIILRSRKIDDEISNLVIINNNMYFMSERKGKIFKANLDGTNVKCIFSMTDYFGINYSDISIKLVGACNKEIAVYIEAYSPEKIATLIINHESSTVLDVSEVYNFSLNKDVNPYAESGFNLLFIDMDNGIAFVNCNEKMIGVNKLGQIVNEWTLKNDKNEQITGYYIDGEYCLYNKWVNEGEEQICKLFRGFSDGTSIVLVNEYVSQTDMGVVDDYVYYYNGDGKLSRVKLDGTSGEGLCY